MTRAILSAALAVAVVAGVLAQDKPNFEGSWRLDQSRSKFKGGALPEMITVEGSKMTVTRTAAGNAQSTVYMLDGTPSKTMQGPAKDVEVTATSKWEGDVLVTTTSAPLVTYIERRSLQADGTMRVELTINFTKEPRSESGWKVFNKVK